MHWCPPHTIFKAILGIPGSMNHFLQRWTLILNTCRYKLNNTVVLNFNSQVIAINFSASSFRTIICGALYSHWHSLRPRFRVRALCLWGHSVLRLKVPFSFLHLANSWWPSSNVTSTVTLSSSSADQSYLQSSFFFLQVSGGIALSMSCS